MAVAQGFRVTGQVIYVAGADSTPVTDRQAVLHRVSLTEAGPVDSGLTDASGRFALRAPVLDTTANYVVSVEHDGIAYFTEPVHTFGETGATAAPLYVYDTSTTEPQIVLRERHIVIRAPAAEGGRRVIELLVLVNRGTKTRVLGDTASPVWQGAIPSSAVEFEVGESDMAAEAVYRRGNTVAVDAPIPPGERQVLLSYLIPTGDRSLPIRIDQPIERFNVLLEDTAAAVEGPLVLQGLEELEQLSFRRYFAENIGAQTRVTVRFAAQPLLVSRLWWIIVPLVVASLLAGLIVWWRRAEPLSAPHAALPSNPDVLAAQIAALDVAFEDHPHDATYRQQRAKLKEHLIAALNRQT